MLYNYLNRRTLFISESSFGNNPSGFFLSDFPVVRMSPELLQAQSTDSPAVGLLHLASGQACFGVAFLPFLMKQLYRCESVVIASFVGTGYPTRWWGWLLGQKGYGVSITTPYNYSKDRRNQGRTLKTLLDGPTPWQIIIIIIIIPGIS